MKRVNIEYDPFRERFYRFIIYVKIVHPLTPYGNNLYFLTILTISPNNLVRDERRLKKRRKYFIDYEASGYVVYSVTL